MSMMHKRHRRGQVRLCGRAGFHFLFLVFVFGCASDARKVDASFTSKVFRKGEKQCDHGNQKFSEPKWFLVVYYRSDKGGRDHISMWWRRTTGGWSMGQGAKWAGKAYHVVFFRRAIPFQTLDSIYPELRVWFQRD